ncbi:hypothetical protein [Solitalea lacus]|uniref:hypothetical protein n=1 Tax=Solitalea lacus TaxID=2911172 RepID=UPI001EDC14C3|nr:hypothetical protein [Solitalea lacus]UKJ06501.1 hypothetical protein L2B55_13270 [Solitalea lacus]
MGNSQFEIENTRYFHQLLLQLPLFYFQGQYFCFDDVRNIPHDSQNRRLANPEE